MTESAVIRTVDGFAAIAGEWRECLATMPGANPFLTHTWLSAWYDTLGGGAELRVVVLRREGRLVAAAPLCRRHGRYYGVPVNELVWIGHRTSDRMQFLIRDQDPVLADELWRCIGRLDDGTQLVRLEEVATPSVTTEVMSAADGRIGREASSVLPWVQVDDWEAFEKAVPRKFRSELRTRVKVFDSWGSWRMDVTAGEGVAPLLPRLAELEETSAKGAGGYAFLAESAHRELLTRVLAARDWEATATLFRLEVDDTLVAYLLGFVHGGSFCAYNMAFRPGYEKGSPGKWLFHEAMRWAHENGLREFDFLRGASYMKSRWRPRERRNSRFVAFAPGLTGWALATAVFRVRPWLKRIRNRTTGNGAD